VDIPKKKNKGRCPHCKKWIVLEEDETMKLLVLRCCKTYSLFAKPEPPKKRKKKK